MKSKRKQGKENYRKLKTIKDEKIEELREKIYIKIERD